MEFGELNCVQGRRNGYKMDYASKMLFMRMAILLVSLMMMLILRCIDPESHDFCLSYRYLCLKCAPSRAPIPRAMGYSRGRVAHLLGRGVIIR